MSDDRLQMDSRADKSLYVVSRIVSWLFTPFMIPTMAVAALFLFSYLKMMPMRYRLFVCGIVFLFTVLLPIQIIIFYKWLSGIKLHDLNLRKNRYMPFLLTILAYVSCLILLVRLMIPWYITGIILTALSVQVLCVIFNLKWRLSEHMAGAGCVVGGVVVFGTLFGFNPVFWLSVFILISGILGSARMILQNHTLGEVLGGFVLGYVCSMLVLNPSSFLFRIFI